MPITVLMVAEKPSLAASIAQHLSGGKVTFIYVDVSFLCQVYADPKVAMNCRCTQGGLHWMCTSTKALS